MFLEKPCNLHPRSWSRTPETKENTGSWHNIWTLRWDGSVSQQISETKHASGGFESSACLECEGFWLPEGDSENHGQLETGSYTTV